MSPPTSTPARIAIKLKPAAERMVKKGHPWVFDASITKQSSEGKAGDLAIIFDQQKNKFLACGLYDPHSPIRIKLLQFHQSAVIDGQWLAQKIQQAKELRKPLLDTDTNSYRLIYGENDGLPGLIADVYARTLVLKVYSAIWWPYWEQLLPPLIEASGCENIVLRLSRALQSRAGDNPWKDGDVIYGILEGEEVLFKEHGLNFVANVIRGHKTGYFLDHRHNRHQIGLMATDKRVLDVFSYAGGFSVHALAGGAREVTSIDISAQALEVARGNAALNPHKGQHLTLAADAFAELENLARKRETYDIVIIDPPAFAKQADEIERALFQYQRLASLGAVLVRSGGLLLLASCSSRVGAEDFFRVSEAGIKVTGRNFHLEQKTFHDVDHPVTFPEGAYLKAGYYRLDGNRSLI